MFEDIRDKLQRASQNNKRTYDLRRRDVTYYPSQIVWRKNKIQSDAVNYISAKLAPKFVGLFAIVRKINSASYELRDIRGKDARVWHVQNLKPKINEDYS